MLRSLLRICALAILLSWTALVAHASLDAYIKRPEPAYKWELRDTQKAQGGTVYDLHLVSQTWQGIEWQHRLQIFMPEHPRYPHFCTLLNTGGNGGAQDALLGAGGVESNRGSRLRSCITYPTSRFMAGGPRMRSLSIPGRSIWRRVMRAGPSISPWQRQ